MKKKMMDKKMMDKTGTSMKGKMAYDDHEEMMNKKMMGKKGKKPRMMKK